MSIPYWVAESTGFLIDNQRGATLGGIFNPLLQEETSPMGLFFVQVMGVLFFSVGGIQATLTNLYESYLLFPVYQLLPAVQSSGLSFFAAFIGFIFQLVLTYAAPVLIILFLSELGLGLINRFAPNLNVFSESLGIKAGIGSFILLLYSTFLFGYFKDIITSSGALTRTVFSFFQQ
jgi:type III secretion protein T